MSAGPIRAWRDSWKPAEVSTRAGARVCFKKPMDAKSACGRRPKVSCPDWSKVNCSDCSAAHRAAPEPEDSGAIS